MRPLAPRRKGRITVGQGTLAEAASQGRRALFGIDHQWSWPRDLWCAAGLGQLHRLLSDAATAGIPVLAWPFDALADDGRSHVGLEVYPSFCRPPQVTKSHDADARACCEWASRADLGRRLDLRAPRPVRDAARIEGWIPGADSLPPGERAGAAEVGAGHAPPRL